MQTRDVLFGREGECARIDQLADEARAGGSGALLIRGEAGIGKSALLEHAVAHHAWACVVRVTCIEAESGFDFAGLQALLQPLLDRLDEIPPVQAAALRGALALAEPAGVGRLFIGAATLSLLAAGAEESSLLCIVDDAHALDSASAAALAFAARRLGAEGVAMLFAVRDKGSAPLDQARLPELPLQGLDAAAARALLEQEAHVAVSPDVVGSLVESTGGNPRALVDLAASLSANQLAGADPVPHPLPIGGDLQEVFARRATHLSDEGRRALVIAAAADTRAMRVISRAGGATRDGFEECEGAGLLEIADGQVDFSHPLVRPSVYHQATAAEKRQAHGAIAEAFAGDQQYAAREAWHAAVAVVDADEAVAARLERVAHAAAPRRGHVSAPTMFERAAALTPDSSERVRRLYLAARAAWLGGDPAWARRLLPADPPVDALVRADVAYLLARLAHSDGGASPDLLDEAERVEAVDAIRAARLLTLAADAANSDRVGLARRAVGLASGSAEAELLAYLALARALAGTGAETAAVVALARAKALLTGERVEDPELILAMVDTAAAVDAGDDEFTRELIQIATAAARAHAVVVLPRALVHSAWLALAAGRWVEALVEFAEAERLADEVHRPDERVAAGAGRALLDALQGREDAARATAAELPEAAAQRILGLLALGSGAANEAAAHLSRCAASDPARTLLLRGLPPVALDLVEAHVRAGDHDAAFDAAGAIAPEHPAAAWASALLGDIDAFALAGAGFEHAPFLAARVRLNHGEALRRAGARRDARTELSAALEVFERLGATPWIERAQQELRASGATVQWREATAADTLTPQELQVARTVANEATYKDAAAKLFLSPKTIEYHLSKVYRKLGITSGRQLAARLAEEGLLE